MTRRKIIILTLLLLAVAVAVFNAPQKERERRVADNPRYLDPIYLEVPKDFAPIKPALGKEIEGKRSTYVFDPSTPKIRFAVSRGGREYWLESELEGAWRKEIEQQGNSIVWNQILPGVDAKYDTYDGYVKETFALADANAPRVFTFKLTPGEDVILDDREGGYVMVKSALDGEELFMLRPPQGLDARNYRVDYKYRLDKSDTSDRSYILMLYPSSPEQFDDVAYPVAIDPSHQVVEWDEALVNVGEKCPESELGCAKDGDIIEIKPAGWNWGTAERREFVIVKVPKMTKEQREEHTRRTDTGVVQYAIDYTQLAAPEELSAIRDPAQLSSVLDATRQPNVIKRKSNPKASVIPQERRLSYSPPPQSSGLKKILLALVKTARAATTVTSSIGTASRDYSTLQAWETAKNGDLVTLDQIQKGETYNDSTFTAGLTIDGSTTDATHYITLTVATGQRHNGTAGTGVKVSSTAFAVKVIGISDPYVTVDGLEISDTGNYEGVSIDANNATVKNMLIYDLPSGRSGGRRGIYVGSVTDSGILIYNNIIYNTSLGEIQTGIYHYWDTTTPDKVYNNTIYKMLSYGIYVENRSASQLRQVEIRNNLIVSSATADYFEDQIGAFVNELNNLSSDGTADDFGGTGHLVLKTAANQFVSITSGSENLHLKLGADAINAGTDLSGTFTDDIDAVTRSGTWDMGADEIVNSTPTITSVTDTPDPVAVGNSVSFSVDWNDADAGENIKVKICKTDSLTSQNCDGGVWATSTAFTTSDPEAVTYTTVAESGVQSYWAFVCDDEAACSSSSSGAFTVRGWYSNELTKRIKITLDNSAQASSLSNFPASVQLNSSRINYADTMDSGQDIRFLDSDDTTRLEYEIEKWDETATSTVWVKVPTIDTTGTDYIWMYYGNSATSSAATTTGVWDSSYVGVWHMNSVYDSTSNNNFGNNNGAATTTPADFTLGNAFDFESTESDYIRVADKASLDITNAITIEAWQKLESYGIDSLGTIVDKDWASGYSFFVDNTTSFDSGTQSLEFQSAYPAIDLDSNSSVLSTGVWRHVVFVYDRVNGDFYVNAVDQGGGPDTSAIAANNLDVLIGSGWDSGAIYYDFDGLLDEVRLSNTNRSVSWITFEYCNITETCNTYGTAESSTGVSGARVRSGTLRLRGGQMRIRGN